MKQKLLLLAMALLGLSGTAMADDITFSVGEIQEGKFGVVTVYVTIEKDHYNGFQVEWTKESMPEGIEVESIEPSDLAKDTYPDLGIDFNLKDDAFVLMGYNMKDATEYLPIGENQPICNIYFKADKTKYPAGSEKVTLDVIHAELSLMPLAVHFAGEQFGYPNKEIELTFVDPYVSSRTIDAESKYEIHDSYGGYAENITVIRNIKAETWSTLCLPFDIKDYKVKENIFGTDATIFSLKDEYAYDADENIITLDFSKVNRTKPIVANTLYIIKTSKDISEFTVNEVVVKKESVSSAATWFDEDSETNILIQGVGVYKYQPIPKNGIFLNDNAFYYSTGTSNVKATRGYFVLDDYFFSEDGAGANIIFTIDDEPTAIEGLSTTNYRPNDNVYSISGVYMGKASDMKKLPRGMYIVNNKKITVK